MVCKEWKGKLGVSSLLENLIEGDVRQLFWKRQCLEEKNSTLSNWLKLLWGDQPILAYCLLNNAYQPDHCFGNFLEVFIYFSFY